MKQRTTMGLIFLLLGNVAASALGQSAEQSAQALAERARNEGSNRAKQVQDYCAAAQMLPKDKNLAKQCSSYKAGLLQDDTAWLAVAITAYRSHDLDRADSAAKQVSAFDPKISEQAHTILEMTRNDRLLAQLRAAWEKGDFRTAASLAQGISAGDDKTAANAVLNNINLYNSYIQQAGALQMSNPQEALKQLALAQTLNPNGPGNIAARIAALQKAQGKPAPPPPVAVSKAPQESGGDAAARAAKVIGDARAAEKQGNLQEARTDYAAALKLQPGNVEAQKNLDRLDQAIRNDPGALKQELAAGIRAFYGSRYEDARRSFMIYLESMQSGRNPGAADFYLGAAMVEQSILETPREKWQGPSPEALSAFKEARKANYRPLRAWFSPLLLKIWDSTAQ